ncbi:CoA ester lyase [Sphingobium sp. SCG-1]|uniref:HpcH/HpaI aldolase/citrate lyase family protein n=1 Tax=Sphingobium sp. SCG-1 TaxID=2072936 RepID=UPI000CD6AB81|nr:CoA ester lyase [Sphingobium sp. SCG-1]AUW57807.1 CoA ester lyase [Sphingobium sp. SCG-1]
MRLRSLLFVPGDRPERFSKAAASGADALILDLEDSVSPDHKPSARSAVLDWLASDPGITTFVRINPLDSGEIDRDLDTIAAVRPDGIVLPKAEGGSTVRSLQARARTALPPVLPIAAEHAAGIFGIGSFAEVEKDLAGLTWGVEDLATAVGAGTPRDEDGGLTSPFAVARALTLFGAHAASVPAIETVFADIHALDALGNYVARARRDGFSGMMAIHPNQIAAINAGFTPSHEDATHARRVVAAFNAAPGAGALKLDGKMVDRPHLQRAERLLAAYAEG